MSKPLSEQSSLLLRTSDSSSIENFYTDPEILSAGIEKAHPDRWHIIPSLWCGAFLAALDSTVVAATYANMGSSLGDSSKASWVATAYMLSSAALQPLYGGLSDIFGRKKALMWANGLFLLGSLGCSMSQTMTQLVVARTVAGLGGAGLGTLSSIVVSDLVPLRERSTYNGFANLVYGCGQVVGAPLGGYLADTVGWRFAFWIQCPITLISLLVIYTKVNIPIAQSMKISSLGEIDFFGSAALIIAVVSLLIFSQSIGEVNSPDSSLILLILLTMVFFVSFITFVWIESTVINPIVPLNTLLSRNPLLSGLTNLFGYAGAFAVMFNVPLFLQIVVGETASMAGSRLISNVAGMCSGSLGAGFIIRRTQKFYAVLIVGVVLEIVGAIGISSLHKGQPDWVYQLCTFPSGAGHGIVLSASLMAVISSVSKERQARATSISYLFRVCGGAFGVSMTASVNNFFLRQGLEYAFAGVPDKRTLILKIMSQVTYIDHLSPELKVAAVDVYNSVIHKSFYVTIGVHLLSACFALGIEEYPLNR
ncbi:CYFA0S08e02080g1_1 [Cyberlindnera fabianii]|uniref:CYFA0S08e02080g1_1 n=1 Tax=Cyberlindnera fabianii TaxID=36022 RepID=A0A061B2U3_CYBFA|nr:CYFA0S08e02080g1_1 [Cyberlindnera fabianii]